MSERLTIDDIERKSHEVVRGALDQRDANLRAEGARDERARIREAMRAVLKRCEEPECPRFAGWAKHLEIDDWAFCCDEHRALIDADDDLDVCDVARALNAALGEL